MKIVIDTNVLVAALRSRRGASFKLVSLLPNDEFSIAISVPLVFEYEDALKRPESAAITEQDIGDFVTRLWALGSDHGNQQLIQHNDSVWTPYVMLRAPLLGVKTAL